MSVINKRHLLDIYAALDIAHVDSALPGTKRSYTAAEKALLSNEALLLAAPALLESAKWLLKQCNGDGEILDDAMSAVAKAIAKAEGEKE